MAVHRLPRADRPPVPFYVSVAVALLLGVFLILQPERWANTPSYALLLDILPQHIWGMFYLLYGSCLALTLYVRSRIFTVFTITAGVALLVVWLVAFIVRFATDDGTTIANIIAWSVYLALLTEAALALDEVRV